MLFLLWESVLLGRPSSDHPTWSESPLLHFVHAGYLLQYLMCNVATHNCMEVDGPAMLTLPHCMEELRSHGKHLPQTTVRWEGR